MSELKVKDKGNDRRARHLIEKLRVTTFRWTIPKRRTPLTCRTELFQNVMLAVSENESRQLALIDEALLRIDDEEYGPCQNCQNAINPKRLAAIPWARYCLNCQELLEQGLLEDE